VNVRITIEVQAPDALVPANVVDEIVSNLESCGWVVVFVEHELPNGGERV
jgi:hypothetical protein